MMDGLTEDTTWQTVLREGNYHLRRNHNPIQTLWHNLKCPSCSWWMFLMWSLRLHMTFGLYSEARAEVQRSKLHTYSQSHPCWWWGHWVWWKRAWELVSTLAPGCYAAWLAAQWSPLGGYAALAHTAALAAISCCESRLGPRSLDTPGGTQAHRHREFNFYNIESSSLWGASYFPLASEFFI